MEHDPIQRSRTRENVLIFTLVLFLGGLIVFFLDFISFGIFTYALGVGGLIVVVGCLHYVVWGRSMSEQVAQEREQMLLKEEQEAELRDHPEGIQDLTTGRGIMRGRPGKR
jgi:hypothetical protein